MDNSDLKPSFYIIFDPVFIDQQSIPPNFINYVTKELGESVTLSLPCGRHHWDIQLRKTENGVYFDNGWETFLKDNTLGDSEFLLFTYCGNMCFEVEIFEKTGCRRNYQITFTNGEQSRQENREKSSFLAEKRKRGRPKKIKKNPLEKVKNNSPKKIETNPPKKIEYNPRKKVENSPPKTTENDPHLVSGKRKPGRPRKIVGSTSGIQHKLQPSESGSDMDEKPHLPLGSSGRLTKIN